jgi:hypothetical protein
MKKHDSNKKNMSSTKDVRGVSNVRPKTKKKKNSNSNRKRRTNNIKKMREKQIVVKRSSGRRERFDTNRMAQTVSRSGVPFLMARDVAKNVSNKIRKQNSLPKKRRNDQHNIARNAVDPIRDDNEQQQAQQRTEDKTVTASQIRGLVASELRDRNRGDIAASYIGETPENTLGDQTNKQNKSDRISVTGATQHTRQPANRNRVIHDMSKRGGGIST